MCEEIDTPLCVCVGGGGGGIERGGGGGGVGGVKTNNHVLILYCVAVLMFVCPTIVPYYSGSGVSTQSYASDTKSKDDTSSAEILHDRIREISDRIHGLTSLDRQQNSGHDYKELFNSPPRNSGGLTTDVASYLEGSTNGRDNASSRNSTLVDDEGELTYSSSDESSSIDGTELGEQATNSSSVSRATMVHSEICNFSRSAPEVGFHEDIEVNGLDSGSDGDNQRRENGSSNESIGTRTTRSSSHDSGMDPKLFKALEKMRKLDERLANITKVGWVVDCLGGKG